MPSKTIGISIGVVICSIANPRLQQWYISVIWYMCLRTFTAHDWWLLIGCHLSKVGLSFVSLWFVFCQPLFRHLSAVGLSAAGVSFVSQWFVICQPFVCLLAAVGLSFVGRWFVICRPLVLSFVGRWFVICRPLVCHLLAVCLSFVNRWKNVKQNEKGKE